MAEVIEIQNYIDGKFFKSDKYFESFNPSTNQINALVPDSTADDVNKAVDSAKQAFKAWSKTSQSERAKLLNKVADLIEKNSDELAKLESIDQGKPLWLAQTLDIPRAAFNFRHFANSLQSDSDMSIIDVESGLVNYTIHEPIGVVGVITPWNLPIYLLTFKLAPALSYGNTVVVKPSEMTSVTAYKLCHILEEAGIPKGVVNMVFGYGKSVGESIVSHPDVPLISFTGSTVTGKSIAIKTGPLLKKLSLEMGGKNSAIVFDDIDLDKTMPQIIRSCFLNSGQICLASSRIYVEKSAYNKFVQKFIEEALKIKVGDPLEKDTLIGPLVSKLHENKVKSYVEIARKEGATVVANELKLPMEIQNGYYVAPTVITNINESSVCMKEEIFGPVVCIVPFDTQEEVIQKANDSDYGLSATVWSSSVDRIHSVAHSLKVGTVWCNCWLVRNLNMPFGGMKTSGVGRESTHDSREFHTQKKTVCLKINT